MKKWGRYNQESDNAQSVWTVLYHSIASVLLICWWLTAHLGIGEWVFLPGFFLVWEDPFTVAYKLYLSVTSHQRKEKKKNKVSFNRHH